MTGPIREVVRSLPTYALLQAAELRAEVEATGVRVIDFTIGEPREETPEFLRRALVESVPRRTSYPPTHGTERLREAAAGWLARRFGVRLDPATSVLAANGSKEALFSLAAAIVEPGPGPAGPPGDGPFARGEASPTGARPESGPAGSVPTAQEASGHRTAPPRNVVLVPDPAYPVYATGARVAGAEVVPIPLEEGRGFLPDLDALPADLLARTAILWVNYPNNPTGAVAPREFYARAVALAREHGFWLASDEAYVELYDGGPPPSALEQGVENVIAFHTLSKRSALAGFRTGFVAGDPALLSALRRLRPSTGVATPTFIQAAAAAAWDDDAHVAATRALYTRKRVRLHAALEARGAHLAGGEAGFFLYFRPPGGEDAEACTLRLLRAGIALVPGERFGANGRGWIRLALVPTVEECEEAAAILEREL